MWHPPAPPRPQQSQRWNLEKWLQEQPEVGCGSVPQLEVRALESYRTKLESLLPNYVNSVSHFTFLSLNYLICKMGTMLHFIQLT